MSVLLCSFILSAAPNMSGRPRRRVTYDHVLLFDFSPIPPFQHVSCMPLNKSGLDAEAAANLNLTRQARLLQRKLNIYEEQHTYIIVAKTDSDCDNVDRGRAVTVINDFVYTKLKDGVRIDQIPELLVDTFDSRVIKLVPYVANFDRPQNVPRTGFTARKRPIFSSEDHEEPKRSGPPLKTTRVANKVGRSKETVNVPVSQNAKLPPGACVVANCTNVEAVTMTNGLTPLFVTDEGEGAGHEKAEIHREPSRAAANMPEISRQASTPAANMTIVPPDPCTPSANKEGSGTPADGSFAFASPHTAALQTPPTVRRHRSAGNGNKDTPLQTILIRLDNSDQVSTRRFTKLAAAMKFLTNTAETMAGDIAELRESVRELKARAIAKEATDLFLFPLKSKEEVYAYVEKDPSMKQAMERYVPIRLSS